MKILFAAATLLSTTVSGEVDDIPTPGPSGEGDIPTPGPWNSNRPTWDFPSSWDPVSWFPASWDPVSWDPTWIDIPGQGTGDVTDPHLLTFDGLSFDCQAAGEFKMVTSLEDDSFQIQQRFTTVSAGNCAQATVATGVAVKDGTTKPTIQISIPRAGQASLNTVTAVTGPGTACPVDFYVDGTASLFDAILPSPSVILTVDEPKLTIEHVDTSLKVDVEVQSSSNFGCFLMVQVFKPASLHSGETILGLSGTPNGDQTDDWRRPDGTVLAPPATVEERLFKPAYDYCRLNWCIDDEANSIFTHDAIETFASISACDAAYVSNGIESDVANPPQELADACGTNLACIVDGLCGDINDALTALNSQQLVLSNQAQYNSDLTPPPTPPPILKYVCRKDSKECEKVCKSDKAYEVGKGPEPAVSKCTAVSDFGKTQCNNNKNPGICYVCECAPTPKYPRYVCRNDPDDPAIRQCKNVCQSKNPEVGKGDWASECTATGNECDKNPKGTCTVCDCATEEYIPKGWPN